MENCYGPPSKHQSIYTLWHSYSLVTEDYLQSLAAKGFKPENPEKLILKIEYYKAENIQLLMTQTALQPTLLCMKRGTFSHLQYLCHFPDNICYLLCCFIPSWKLPLFSHLFEYNQHSEK